MSPRLGWYLFSFPISLSQSQPIFQSISVFLSLSVPSQGLVGGDILWTSGLLHVLPSVLVAQGVLGGRGGVVSQARLIEAVGVRHHPEHQGCV